MFIARVKYECEPCGFKVEAEFEHLVKKVALIQAGMKLEAKKRNHLNDRTHQQLLKMMKAFEDKERKIYNDYIALYING